MPVAQFWTTARLTRIIIKASATLFATGLAGSRKKYFLARDVGHYGIFNGSTWRKRIAPVVEEWMQQHDRTRLKVVA